MTQPTIPPVPAANSTDWYAHYVALDVAAKWLLANGGGGAGTPGADGKSAYDIWLELGNTGTEADFMADLKGEPGSDGAGGGGGGGGILHQAAPGEPYVEGEARVHVGFDFPAVIVNGSLFYREVS